jgi:Copper transport outer membrane protein, MctB
LFDLRYHVASLAAVFLALIIGILLGVGISSGGFLRKSERSLLNRQVADLQSRLDEASQRAGDLGEAQRNAQTFVQDTYPALMQDRLRGKRVAIVFIGSTSPRQRALVERTLEDAGATGVLRERALKLPIDESALDATLGKRPALSAYLGEERLDELGRRVAREFMVGEETVVSRVLAPQLVEERSGNEQRPADAVVVVRTVPAQRAGTARFLSGFYSGLASVGVPAVGVETSDSGQSAVEPFHDAGLATVDDLDTPAGRLALALLLAGARSGQYGQKATARDGLLPPVEPSPIQTQAGG